MISASATPPRETKMNVGFFAWNNTKALLKKKYESNSGEIYGKFKNDMIGGFVRRDHTQYLS